MEEWDYLGGHGDLYDNVMMENPHPVIILGGFHSVVSVPDLEISNRTDDITDTGGKNNNPGDAEAATNPSQTSLSSEKGNPADIDPTDIMGEPASCDGSVVRSHTGDNPFICSECGNVLSTKYDLNEHYRIHEIFKCIACGRSFSSHEDLVLHQRIHTGERPFKCTECGKGFTRAAHLVAHKVIHTGVKRFQCNECGATFNRSSNLKSHKWIHTGEKPFKCNVCGIGFTRAFILSKHKMIHEGDSQFICSDCGKVFTMWQHFIQHQEMHKI